jgi:PAS domain S-box-containing protein
MVDPQGIIVLANQAITKTFGYTLDELIGQSTEMLVPTHQRAHHARLRAAPDADHLHRPMGASRHLFGQHKDGHRIPVEIGLTPVQREGGTYVIASVLDISERVRSEEALRVSEAHHRAILEHIGDAVFVTSRNGHFLDVNPQACELTGYSRLELLQLTTADTYTEEEREFAKGRLDNIAKHKVHRFERSLRRKDGTAIRVEVNATVLPDGRLLSTLRDITERTAGERALRESEERFRQLAEHIREVFFVMDPVQHRMIYVSPIWEEVWGRPVEEVYRKPMMWLATVDPQDRDSVLASQRALLQGKPSSDTFRILRPDGTTRWIRGRAFPINDSSGAVTRIVGVAEDITELKQTEQQLLQAQKMEAVGRLAGGVAHDFNNILTAIFGYTDFLDETLPEEGQQHEDLLEIRKAGERAASLTRQLLAFSRQQVLEPVVLKINDLVGNVEKMLRRVIGEDVTLRTVLATDVGNVKADPGQIEQVLMNLAVNARDAMPTGGQLLLETQNVELTPEYAALHQSVVPGAYVMLAVSDTGIGMSPETIARIFEPFFTTKERGKGTGLGLSTVYGIVKQSGGYVWVYSEVGKGTTFKIYFPRVDAPPEQAGDRRETKDLTGTETVLVAEDDEIIRPLSKEVLSKLGYTVLVAGNSEEALRVAGAHTGPIHLLVADVVMPGGSGRELARRLAETRPATKVVYVSGYTNDAIFQHGVLEPGLNFLQKPFAPAALARKVREVLDS